MLAAEQRRARMVHRFEIFRQTYDRWSWRFVVVDDDQSRVLARSGRTYRSRRRARRAIRALKRTVPGAPVVVTGPSGQEGFPLPATSFAFVPGVVPLVVGRPPSVYEPAGAYQGAGTGAATLAELRTPNGEPVQVQEARPEIVQAPAEAATPEPPAEPEPEKAKKPATRRASRRQTSK
jgi:uncharacterized protein YegP (UPF0339 family)